MIKNRITFTAYLCVLLACLALSYANSAGAGAEQKPKTEQVKSSLEQIKDKIRSLTQALTATREKHDSSTEALKKAEVAVSLTKKKLNDIQEAQAVTKKKLGALNQELEQAQQALVKQQKNIGAQLTQQYTHGQSSQLQLLLENKDPNNLTRDMKYFGYLTQARLDQINALQQTMGKITSIKEETAAKNLEVESLKKEYQTQAQTLEQDKANKAKVVAELAKKMENQQQQIQRLKQDEHSLLNLIQRLTAQAEKRKQEREKRIAENKRKSRKDSSKEKQGHRKKPAVIDEQSASPDLKDEDSEDNSPSKTTVARNEALPDDNIASANFNALRGQLRLPVRGEVTNRFGTSRADTGVTWKGLFIRAHEGNEVKSVANGRVVFADWMRGFGNLIIVDHGNGYMTLYGNNEALLKSTGQSVHAGDTIASVGNSGGNPESGVYYEVRRNSVPLDPLQWSRLN